MELSEKDKKNFYSIFPSPLRMDISIHCLDFEKLEVIAVQYGRNINPIMMFSTRASLTM